MRPWVMTDKKELLAELRPSGEVYGHSGRLGGALLRLHKGELVGHLRRLPDAHQVTWKIGGDPAATRKFAKNRRHVIVYLGGDR